MECVVARVALPLRPSFLLPTDIDTILRVRDVNVRQRPRGHGWCNSQPPFVTDMPDDIAVTAGDLYPDVSVAEAAAPQGSGPPPTMVAPAPIQMATVMPSRVPHVTIEIRDVAQRELVTAIEILSPTNKRGEGYREYLNKRRRLLCSMAHLIEIDLLRRGRRVPMQQALPPAPYFIFVSRAERRPIVEVWP